MTQAAASPARARPVDTKTAERRALNFRSLDELLADLATIEAAHRAGTLRTTGNWTPAQVCQHCAILMRCAIDGFPGKAPWFVRAMAILLYKKAALSGKPGRPGFKLPPSAAFLLPDDDVTFDQGLAELREVVARVKAGERFTQRSPVFGRLSHEEWTTLQLAHCSMHLSFLWPR